MLPLSKGHYTARLATSAQDMDRALALRHLCFVHNRGLSTKLTDADRYDDDCQHVLIEQSSSKTLVCCFRLLSLSSGAAMAASYAARFYDLTKLAAYPSTLLELGRFCSHPDHSDPAILRLAWGVMTAMVDDQSVGMLFGCSSFSGTDPAPYQDAFALLKDAHLAPDRWRPGVKAEQSYPFRVALQDVTPDAKHAFRSMPPLLRTYLAMGGWVSDHAVIDTALNTLHVFTGVEIATIPAARARALRAIAAGR